MIIIHTRIHTSLNSGVLLAAVKSGKMESILWTINQILPADLSQKLGRMCYLSALHNHQHVIDWILSDPAELLKATSGHLIRCRAELIRQFARGAAAGGHMSVFKRFLPSVDAYARLYAVSVLV